MILGVLTQAQWGKKFQGPGKYFRGTTYVFVAIYFIFREIHFKHFLC